MSRPSAQLNARDVAKVARDLRGDRAVTCCCHIVVDDPNFDDHHVAFCIQYAAKNEHAECLHLALLLAKCSFTQRRRVNFLAWSRELD
jgi:hypothetical protein